MVTNQKVTCIRLYSNDWNIFCKYILLFLNKSTSPVYNKNILVFPHNNKEYMIVMGYQRKHNEKSIDETGWSTKYLSDKFKSFLPYSTAYSFKGAW